MIKRCAQKLLGYQYAVIPYKHKVIKEADYSNTFYEPKISINFKVPAILMKEEKYLLPETYYNNTFHTLASTQHIGKYKANSINTIST